MRSDQQLGARRDHMPYVLKACLCERQIHVQVPMEGRVGSFVRSSKDLPMTCCNVAQHAAHTSHERRIVAIGTCRLAMSVLHGGHMHATVICWMTCSRLLTSRTCRPARYRRSEAETMPYEVSAEPICVCAEPAAYCSKAAGVRCLSLNLQALRRPVRLTQSY